jgi:hypothetical protein
VDDAEDDGQEDDLTIRISFVVWNPGFQDDNKKLTNDFEGYRDLVNLIELTKHELKVKRIIQNKITVRYPIKRGMYQEQPYPYWYGWITFKIQQPSCEYIPDKAEQYFK